MDADQRTENLKTLLSMFPDVDSEICEAVLASNDNDLETSINTLLIEYVEEHRSTQQHRRQQQQQEEEDQSSPFSDFTEELPVIKEKIVQAADTTKKKVKEWYEKLKQQSVALRNEYGFYHFFEQQKSSPLRSQQPVYGSYEIDLDKKKDSYSPFKIIEKDNDLITISSSSNINNNNIKSDNVEDIKKDSEV
ncbi:18705_t:CDS:2 [Entrophospora sp. SA101]|nr:18705_t:CDS:2 [Entrophospora sp. SA101]